MSVDVTRIGVEHEPTAWLRMQVQIAEKRRADLMFGQCGHLAAPTFEGWCVFWDSETRLCPDCIGNMDQDYVEASCDRCGIGGALHPCLTHSAHTTFVLALCPGCLEKEVG